MFFIKLIIILITVAVASLFLFLLKASKDYDEMISPLDSKEFVLKDIYGIGFKIMEYLKFDFKNDSAKDLREKIKVLHGDKYAEFYLRVYYAQRISISVFVFVISMLIACLASGSDGLILIFLGFVVSGAIYYYFSTLAESKLKKQSLLYVSDFPDAISTLALLMNSGMTLRDSWTQVAYSNDKPLYLQMQKVSEDMKNGKSEADALFDFSIRCATPEIKKFTGFIIQGAQKGNSNLAVLLKNQSNELWEIKRQSVLQQGQLAASKLLIPIVVMFIGILIMVMGPIMTNLGI